MYHASKPFTRPPKGFLKINTLEEIEMLMPEGSSNCQRCNKFEQMSLIGRNLFNFVCDSCRNDDQEWTYKGSDYTIDEMERQGPDVRLEGFFKRTNV